MDGYMVMSMDDAACMGDIFITVTGNRDIILKKHFQRMKSGAIVCNSGHFNVEIDIPALESLSKGKKTIRNNVERYELKDGRHIYLLGEGRLVNLAAAEGHPSEVMDMSFANQFLSLVRLSREGRSLSHKVHDIDPAQDQDVARLKLQTMSLGIDTLTPEQVKYASDYSAGT